jgi:integrase
VRSNSNNEETRWMGGLKKIGKYYQYRFMVNGKLHKGSTSQERLKNAKIELARLKQKANHHAKGTAYTPLLSETLIEWENTQKSKNHSEKHIENCKRLFEAHVLPITGDIKFDKLTSDLVEEIITTYLVNHSENGTNTLITYVKSILTYGKKKYKIEIPEIEKVSAQTKEIIFLSWEKIEPFLDEIDQKNRKGIQKNNQISLACRIMLDHGWREDEIINMKWKQLNKTNKTYTLDKTKGKESPTILLSDEVMEWIEIVGTEQKKKEIESEYILCQTRGTALGEKHKEGFTSNPIRKASKRIGMNFGPHTLRKTHACLLADTGASAFVVQASLRHKSIQPSLSYVKVVNRTVADAQAKLKEKRNEVKAKSQNKKIVNY